MAILTDQQSRALAEFAERDEDFFRKFIIGLNRKFGPSSSVETLIKRFQSEQPSKWNDFITSIVAQYTATTEDVERAVGRVALSRADSSSLVAKTEMNPVKFAGRAAPSAAKIATAAIELSDQNSEIERLKAELRAARTQQSGQSYADGVEHAKKLQRLDDWRTAVYIALFDDWKQNHANIGNPSNAGIRRVANLIADKTFDTPAYVEGNTNRIIPLVNRARHLDDTPNRFEPTMTAFDLILEASGIQPATQKG